jgi:hypothetical protein
VSNHVLVIALYGALVLVLVLSILIALCLILRWRSSYTLASTSDDGTNSDSASSDLPIIKRGVKGQISARNSGSEHYARRTTPPLQATAPPLAPMDLSLDPKPRSASRKPESGCFGGTARLSKGNDWY